MERSLKKVYINPNFNQRSLVIPTPLQSNSNMHVNSNFPQMTNTNSQQHNANIVKRRIFVNPNFVNQNYAFGASGPPGMSFHTVAQPSAVVMSTGSCSNEGFSPLRTIKEIPKPSLQTSVTKSRYTLVRNITEACVNKVEEPINNKSCTIKINKYKSVRLSYIKNNLRTEEKIKEPIKELPSLTYVNRLMPKPEVPKTAVRLSTGNRKYIKVNKTIPPTKKITESKPIVTKKTLLTCKKNVFNSSFQSNRKVTVGKFKKNNIPCPLFSKYGKCLRYIYGNCEFLHDKKHVSLCRKFLKGICHDASCRFSHELSAKKMPTCYFYLNGMCTKENCPYLHVKLNNATKICNDFLKGYCEKGEKCVYRHVNKGLQLLIKRSMNIQRQYSCSSPLIVVSNKTKIKMKQTLSKKSDIKTKTSSNSLIETSAHNKNDSECRYFKEANKALEQNEVCDVIKPNRCKLGNLPSFIKL